MKKLDVLKMILGTASAIDPRIGLVSSGIEHLIHRDGNPSNDLEETAQGLTDIVLNTVSVAEGLSGRDFVNNAALAAVADNIKRDIVLYVTLAHQLKPAPSA